MDAGWRYRLVARGCASGRGAGWRFGPWGGVGRADPERLSRLGAVAG